MDQGPIGVLPVLGPDARVIRQGAMRLRIALYVVAVILIVISASDLRAGEPAAGPQYRTIQREPLPIQVRNSVLLSK
jgi:hypothetical protein